MRLAGSAKAQKHILLVIYVIEGNQIAFVGDAAPPPSRLPCKHPVVAALETAGKRLTNTELADAMNVCGGESTKRRREVADLLDEMTSGKFVMIGLKSGRQATA